MPEERLEELENGSRDDLSLVHIAEAVADRTPVEWGEERARTPSLSGPIDRLREIEALHAAHLRLLREAPFELGAPPLFVWGPLRALERIGEGSFAEVFRAWDPKLQREVALKLRRAEAGSAGLSEARWMSEARQLARVRHPNVLVVYGAETHDGRAGIWTELVRGQTLEQWLTAHGPLGAREIAVMGMDLCGALSAVHGVGLVHGDVTTRNVMREGSADYPDGSGRIVLMDFGSAHETGEPGLAAFGTPAFAAPEVLDGEAPTARSDVYSLGIVLYRMVSAHYPVELTSVAGIRQQLRQARVPLRQSRHDLPADFVHVVERACAVDFGERFATPADLEQALGGVLHHGARAVPARRLPKAAAIAVALATIVIALFVLVLGREKPTPPAPVVASPRSQDAKPDAPGRVGAADVSAPRMLEVEATLYRMTAGTKDVVQSGDLVAPGDGLGLEVQTKDRAHFYVLNEDRQGEVHVLFPLRERGAMNPLAPGVTHWLPGREDGEDLEWRVTTAGGKETLLLLASSEPLAVVERTLASLPQARSDAQVTYPVLSHQALAQLRGIGGVGRQAPLRPQASKGMLLSLADELSRSRSATSFWKRLIVLENPIP